MSSKSANSIRNAFVGGISQAINLVLNFATKTVFIRTLGAVYLGINGTFTNLFVLISSIDFGVGVAMNYSLYHPLANQDYAKVSALYDFYKKLYRMILVIDVVIGLSLFPFLNYIFDPNIENKELYYILFLVNVVLYNMLNYKSYIIIADQKKYITSFYTMIFEMCGAVALIVALLTTKSFALYLVIMIVKTIAYSLFIAFRARKMYPCMKMKQGTLSKGEKKQLYKNAIYMYLYKLSEMMISGTDNLIISVIIGTVHVGYYSNYEFILQGVTSVTSLLFASLAASIGHAFVEKNQEKNIKLFYMIQDLVTWLAGFTTTAILVLAQDFIKVWAGEEYLLSWPILFIIVINFYFCIQRDGVKMFRESAGLFDKMMKMAILNAVVNVVLSILLGMWLGMFGIFVATIISGLLTTYWYEPYLIHKDYLKCSLKKFLSKQTKSLILLAGSVLISYSVVKMIAMTGLAGWIVKAIACAIVSNGFYFIVLRNTEAVKYVIETIKEVLKEKKNGEKR